MIVAAAVALRRGRNPRGEARRSRLTIATAVLATINGLALFASLSAGALVPERSHGALDDGGACAVLVRLAERMKAGAPPARTDITFLLLSGEEIGVHGSWKYAERFFAQPPKLPTAVVNLEFLGATENMGLFDIEAFSLRRYEPDAALVALLDEVHQRRSGAPLHRFGYPAGTDGRSFLAHGVRAATIYNDLPEHAFPRHLHSAADRRDSIDPKALDAALEYLHDVALTADAHGL
jgi:Zn-dependent M28 family amino/carboxypeptidase